MPKLNKTIEIISSKTSPYSGGIYFLVNKDGQDQVMDDAELVQMVILGYSISHRN